MELGRQFKQPHQMSPEEFAAHPAAVFHGTYLPDEDVLDVTKRNPSPLWMDEDTTVDEYKNGDEKSSYEVTPTQKIHLGTFQAALERTSMSPAANLDEHTGNGKPATVHVFWQTPKVLGSTIDEPLKKYIPNLTEWSEYKTEHEPEATAHYAPGSQYYTNINEDHGSVSFATDNPQQTLASQADYVKAALDRGVPESEIHPRTLKLYKAGTLGKMVIPMSTQKLMIKHKNKLGPLKNAGPKEKYVRSDEPAPKRPEI